MIRSVFRRLERLETRAMATTPSPIVIRILFVDPVKGVTGVLVFESDKPATKVTPTPEEVERVRADLDRRRTGSSATEGRRD